MTIQRMIELLEIEHECMLRGAHDDCDRNCADCELVQDDGDLHEMYTDVIALLKEREAVDKNTGEWKNGHCSCCGEDVSSMLDTWTNVQNFLFCPNCGAKMEGR